MSGLPPPVSRELTRLARMVSPAADGLRVGTVVLPGNAPADAVADALYSSWYLGVDDDVGPAPGPAARRDLAPLLRAAHAGTGRFEPGWVVTAAASDGTCAVQRGSEQRVVCAGDYVGLARPGVPVSPGEQVAVTVRVDGVDLPTGWWVSRSPAGEPPSPLGRLYLHVTAGTVARVLHALTRALLDVDWPWSVKCAADATGYRRVDGLVCYAPRAAEPELRALAAGLLADVGDLLEPTVPPLTEALGPGLAYADDPGGGLSFGQHRCRSLAPGVLRLATTPEDGPGLLADALTRAGVDPARPWRAPLDPAPLDPAPLDPAPSPVAP